MVNFDHLLDGVSDATRSELSARRVARRFAAGEDLLGAGEEAPGVFQLTGGRVRSWRPLSDGRAITLCYLTPEAVVGLVACARRRPSPATTTATGPVTADLWPRATVLHLLDDDPAFARNALRIVSDLTVLLMEKLDDSMVPVEQRLGRALLRLASEQAEWSQTDEATLSVSRQELADLTGATLFTASRTLSDWQRRGVVRSGRGRVEITDPQALAEIADLAA